MKKNQKQEGITLIALIITIIVLLILAGVSIATLVGENGILTQANNVKTENELGEEKEQIGLAYNSAKIEKISKNDSTAVKAEELNAELTVNGVVGAEVTGTDTLTVVMPSRNKYTVTTDGKITYIGTEVSEEEDAIDWAQILADATANPEKYKHPEQEETNGDIGIGTDGQPVRLDWWCYNVINDNEISLDSRTGSGFTSTYSGPYTEDGKIYGAVPQYIKVSGKDEFYKVTKIGNGAFYFCQSLTNIEIPNTVTSIGARTFEQCNNLLSIDIPSSVENIGDEAFLFCGLVSIDIPSSVTSIGKGIFAFCSSLSSIKVDANNSKYDSRNNCNAIIEISTNKLVAGCKNTQIPNGVTAISDEAFYGCSDLKNIDIPIGVTSIGESAFSNCNSLSSIEIPSTVASIGVEAFRECSKLEKVYFNQTVAPTFGDGFIFYYSGNPTFYFKNSTVADAFVLGKHYSGGEKYPTYDWVVEE